MYLSKLVNMYKKTSNVGRIIIKSTRLLSGLSIISQHKLELNDLILLR